MAKKCKYQENPCKDSFWSSKGLSCCRLSEWKKKIKVCPYDKKIHSVKVPKNQKKLPQGI